MSATLLDGKQLAQTMEAEIAAGVAEFVNGHGRRPDWRPCSSAPTTPVNATSAASTKPASSVGITSFQHELPATTTEAELLALLGRLNADPAVHGILVQLPLPGQIREAVIVDAVSPLKDVDGFGPVSLGLLAAGRPRFLACTPFGVQQLLLRNNITVAGRARRHRRPQQHRRQTARPDLDAEGGRRRRDRHRLPQPQP